MHGRLKVRTTAEQQEAKRKEREKKLKIYNTVTTNIFEKRRAGEMDEENLSLTRQILEANPDFYTLWNYRKEIFLHLLENSSGETMQKLFEEELLFLVACLKVNPKSYGVWQHRCFVMDTMPHPDWKQELHLCSEFLKVDERNFHCWDYRRFVVMRSGVPATAEFEFTTTKVEETFSNYSAWHYRSKLLPLVHPDPSQPLGITEQAMSNEYSLFQNAVFTDPYDQSAWIYHRWLLGRGKKQQQILYLYASRDRGCILVSLANHIQVGRADALTLEVMGETHECSWLNQLGKKSFSTLWLSDSISMPPNEAVDIKVTLTHQGQPVCSEKVTLQEGQIENFTSSVAADAIFRKEISDVQRDVLEEQVHILEDLDEEEKSKNKWFGKKCMLGLLLLGALLSLVMVWRALGPLTAQQLTKLDLLLQVDPCRAAYYSDLRSRLLMERCIEELPKGGHSLQLRDCRLTAVYHTSLLPCIKRLDLSGNRLTSPGDLSHLQCLETLVLDDNQIEHCLGMERLSALASLSLRNNAIASVEALAPLRQCPALSSLTLEGNPVCQDPTWRDQLLELLPHVKLQGAVPLQD